MSKVLHSHADPASEEYRRNEDEHLRLVAELGERLGRAAAGGGEPPPAQPPPPGHGRLERRGGGRDFVGEAGDGIVQSVHRSSPSVSRACLRKVASAREVWLLTVPTEQPSVCAVAASDRSSQKRSTMTARWRGPSRARAWRRAARSAGSSYRPWDRDTSAPTSRRCRARGTWTRSCG